jgi:hypothetical protein
VKRPTSLPVLVQVAALAALAVVMSQAVAFGVVVLAPEPRPTGFSIEMPSASSSLCCQGDNRPRGGTTVAHRPSG